MNIIFAGPAWRTHTQIQANAMAELGHTVTVISTSDQKDTNGGLDDGINVVYLDVPSDEGGFKKNAKQFKAVISQIPYDALTAFGCCEYGSLAERAGAAKTLLYITGRDVYDCDKNGTKSTVKKSMASAAAVCAPAANVISRAKEVYKKEKAFFEAPYGVDMKLFKKGEKESHGALCFGSIKPLIPGYGVGAVLEAFKKYLEKPNTNAILKVAGTGSLAAPLKQTAQAMGIAGSVEFLGAVNHSDMPAVLREIDVLVELPPEEYFTLTALEAMACEVPVISSDTVGASAFILNAVTGYLVKPSNTDACAARMLELSANNGARERMGKMAREDIEPVYNKEVCADKLLKALNYTAAV